MPHRFPRSLAPYPENRIPELPPGISAGGPSRACPAHDPDRGGRERKTDPDLFSRISGPEYSKIKALSLSRSARISRVHESLDQFKDDCALFRQVQRRLPPARAVSRRHTARALTRPALYPATATPLLVPGGPGRLRPIYRFAENTELPGARPANSPGLPEAALTENSPISPAHSRTLLPFEKTAQARPAPSGRIGLFHIFSLGKKTPLPAHTRSHAQSSPPGKDTVRRKEGPIEKINAGVSRLVAIGASPGFALRLLSRPGEIRGVRNAKSPERRANARFRGLKLV